MSTQHKTAKQKRAHTRIIESRRKRALKRASFLIKLAHRRGFRMDKHPCQTGHMQLVSEVIRLGNTVCYKSAACAGCPIGAEYLQKHKKDHNNPIPETVKGCHLVEECVLIAPATMANSLSPGDRVIALSPASCDTRNVQV